MCKLSWTAKLLIILKMKYFFAILKIGTWSIDINFCIVWWIERWLLAKKSLQACCQKESQKNWKKSDVLEGQDSCLDSASV